MQEQSQTDIMSKFKSRFIKQLIVTIVLLPAIVVVVIARRSDTDFLFGFETSTLAMIAIPLFIIGLVFSFFNWRCPNCNKYLGKEIYPKFCNKCGSQLR